jgi:ribosomal protein L40E
MTEEKSPLKGFRSIGVNPSSPNNQNSEKQSIDKNLTEDKVSFSGTNEEITSITSQQPVLEKNICPKCGKENDKSHSFCSYCGGRLDINEVSTPGNKFVVCDSCGIKNPEDAITCNNCGNFLNIEGSFPPNQSVSYENNAPKFDPYVMPPPVDNTFSESQHNQVNYTNNRFPTVSTTDFKNTMKTGNIGLVSIPILLFTILGLVFGGMAIGLIFDELNIQALSTIGFILMGLGFLIHVVLGFVGLIRLFLKGWTLEVLGCILIGGGSPILFPVLFGIFFYILAEILPHK